MGSRFLTALRSGTTWNQIRGLRPSGSTMESVPGPSSSSGTPTSRQYSSQLAKPAGVGSSTYPRAVRSDVSVVRVAHVPLDGGGPGDLRPNRAGDGHGPRGT